MNKKISRTFSAWFIVSLVLGLCLNLMPAFGKEGTAPKVNWVNGPKVVKVGDDLASLNMSKGLSFANAEDTRKLMDFMGNSVSNEDIGLVVPKDDTKDWMLIFKYDPMGYVKDTDANSLDKDAILQSIKEGTEEGNKRRKEKGIPPINVVGWQEEPHYDPATRNLVWAILGEGKEGKVINYNTRKLGRNGVTSINLVTSPEEFTQAKAEAETIIANYSYVPGKQYSDFDPTKDKVAEIGLTALIAGGAGAAAVKTGILSKILLVLAVGFKKLWFIVVAALAGLQRLFASRKKGQTMDSTEEVSSTDQPPDQ